MDNDVIGSDNLQFELIKNAKHILNLGGDSISNILNKNEVDFFEIKINSETISDISIIKLCDSQLSEFKKYDLIIINELLEKINYPKKLLDYLSNYLLDDGSIIGTIKNFSYIQNILDILNGNFLKNNFLKNNYKFYDLDAFNIFLIKLNFSITELNRIYNDSKLDLNQNFNEFLAPSQIVESLNTDPESNVIAYVFRIKKNTLNDFQTQVWMSQFPKNYFADSMSKKFDFYNNLEQSLKDKDDVILGLKNSLYETKSHLDQLLEDKVNSKSIFLKILRYGKYCVNLIKR